MYVFASRFPLYYMSLIYFITFKIKIPNNMWQYFIFMQLTLYLSLSVDTYLHTSLSLSVCVELLLTELFMFFSCATIHCSVEQLSPPLQALSPLLCQKLFEVFMSFVSRRMCVRAGLFSFLLSLKNIFRSIFIVEQFTL